MGQATPGSARMARAFDGLRVALSRMDPDYAEMVRQDITMLMSVIKVHCEKYGRPSLQRSHATIAPRHLAWVAIGLATEDEDRERSGQIIMWSDRAARIMNREDRREVREVLEDGEQGQE